MRKTLFFILTLAAWMPVLAQAGSAPSPRAEDVIVTTSLEPVR